MKATRMRNTVILIGPHVWSCQNDFSWILFISSHPVNTILTNHSEYIKLSFSFGYFERYVNFKSDYLELLLSVLEEKVKLSPFSASKL